MVRDWGTGIGVLEQIVCEDERGLLPKFVLVKGVVVAEVDGYRACVVGALGRREAWDSADRFWVDSDLVEDI